MKTLLLTAPDYRGVTRLIRNALLSLLLLAAAAAYGGIPSLNVIVSDSSGKVAFKGTTANATFATANLAPGNYVVQFRSDSGGLNDKQYLVVVSAGTKKVMADAVPAEKFKGGGVAMRITVEAGLKITGQVAIDQGMAYLGKIKVIDGKRFVWVKARTGTHLGDHWEQEGLAASNHVVSMDTRKLRQIQDGSFEGSMLDRYPGHYEAAVHQNGGY